MISLRYLPVIWLIVGTCAGRCALPLASPSGATTATLDTDAQGQLVYSVAHQGRTVLKPSPLGIEVDGHRFGTRVTLGATSAQKGKTRFPWLGSRSEVRAAWQTLVVPVNETNSGFQWLVELRCFDNGVAYRCLLPGSGARRVTGELGVWELPEKTLAWCNPDTVNYEGVHVRCPTDQLSRAQFTNGIGMPVTFELAGGDFAALTEANVAGYSGMTLIPNAQGHLAAEFRDDPQGWTMTGPIVTPWRVLMVANDLDGLINCDTIVPALCPEPDKQWFPRGLNTDWIKPGRALWTWWAYEFDGARWSRQKALVDAAAALNCQYYLVDAGWELPSQQWASEGKDVWDRLKELCDYAAARKVGIWVWRIWRYDAEQQWPGLETHAKREEFFTRCAQAGVAGAKVDFMDSESHDRLEFYEDCARVAARHKIMVNFHGANKPTGESRTWPNELTREGVRGLEYNTGHALPPGHYATLPFTRFLAGHGDFTPTTFDPKRIKGTTFGCQLATAVVYTSPFLCWADKAENYQASPAVELIRTLPPVWDETHALPGCRIGELAVLARRCGKEWYVGIINGPQAREYRLSLGFLGRGRWKADFYYDQPGEAAKLVRSHADLLNSSSQQTLQLLSGGGCVVKLYH